MLYVGRLSVLFVDSVALLHYRFNLFAGWVAGKEGPMNGDSSRKYCRPEWMWASSAILSNRYT
jgi:hypothetical protein